MAASLEGQTVALAEGRQLEELAQLLEREGARPLRCPMIGIRDALDVGPIRNWLRELLAGRFDYIVFLTGEGVRRLLGFAEREGQAVAVVAALARAQLVTRGPKPVRALKELGLAPAHVAGMPTTEGVIATLQPLPLQGRVVGVQLYSDAPSPLLPFLESAGATAAPVLPYLYAPAADAERVADLIRTLAAGGVDVIVFTSSPQVQRLAEVAEQSGLTDALRQGLERTTVAAVGPVVADTLRQQGTRVDIVPEQGFVMKNLVQQIKRHGGTS